MGDSSDAYAAFRQAFTAFDAPSEHPDEATVSRMAHAIRAVIEDSRFESVGDLPLAVGVEEDGFRYFTSALMVAGREQSIPSHRWTTVQFGGAAEGGFAYTICPPVRSGVGVVGVHFHQGPLGALFHPTLRARPFIFPSVSLKEFERLVEDRFGIALRGAIEIS